MHPPSASYAQRAGAAVLELLLFGVTLGAGWVVWWITLWDSGRTPAKAVLHLRVARLSDGRPPTVGRMALHELLTKLLVPLALITAAVALVDDQRRSLWDHVTGTIVVAGDATWPPPPPEGAEGLDAPPPGDPPIGD